MKNRGMAEEQNGRFKESKWVSRLAWIFVIIGFLFLADGYAFLKIPATLDQLGNLGSYYQGTVASFWSLAGLLFIYETLRAQKEQLRTQQKQIADEEKSQKRRDFEASFFQLLNFQNQMAEQMSHSHLNWTSIKNIKSVTKEGRECFVTWARNLQLAGHGQKGQLNVANLDDINKIYEEFYEARQANLGHYFRTVYHVFKFCNESGLPESELRRYTSLARAQLSTAELVLLFYNGLSPMGAKFKPLIEKFGLLEHLDRTMLFHGSHKDLYAATAYR